MKKRSSIYRGVTWNREKGRWQAQIRCGGKVVFLGLFADEREAAKVWDQHAKLFRRRRLNFKDDSR